MEMTTHYQQFRPSARLAGLIECYWVFRSFLPPTIPDQFPSYQPQPPHNQPLTPQPDPHHPQPLPSPRDHQLIPGGRVELIFNFGAPFHWLVSKESPDGLPVSIAHFMGQRDRIYFARPGGPADMLGIRFKPGGLPALIALPVSLLLNKMVPAEDILGSVIQQWEALLYEQPGDAARISLLDQLLESKMMPRTTTRQQGLQHAIQSIRNIRDNEAPSPIAAFCQESGWSYKQLERAFLKEVGYTPKGWHRLVRFNRALRQMHASPDESLTSICYDSGYYDQSHFIKDFHRYTGTTPSQFQVGDDSIASFLIRHQPA